MMPKIFRFFLLVLCAGILVLACKLPAGSGKGPGSLSISIGNKIAKTIAPDPSATTVASYAVHGTGPNGATFDVSVTSTPPSTTAEASGLASGTWTVTANALNAANQIIGTGTVTATVNTGTTTAVGILATPVSGTGTLTLTVTWPAAQVQSGSVAATLTSVSSSPQSFPLSAFVTSGNSATSTTQGVPNGYWNLQFSLSDSGVSAPVGAGAAVVWIISGQTSAGTITFSNLDPVGGILTVNITPSLDNPLAVFVAGPDLGGFQGAPAYQAVGASQTLTASAGAGTPDFEWFVNGVSTGAPSGTNTTYTLTPQTAGPYRIDLIAFVPDGSQAGDASVTVQAVATNTGPGSTWSPGPMPSSAGWESVAFGNGEFVALAGGTVAATSPDGINWTARTMPSGQSWGVVNYGNGVFVAVASDGAVATSPDGITWTTGTLDPNTAGWGPVAYGNGVFVAVASTGNINEAATSPDGINWTIGQMPSVQYWDSVAFGNGVFVATAADPASAVSATSPDGINWTQRTMPGTRGWGPITYGNGRFVALGANGATASSPDGINWTTGALPSSLEFWRPLTCGNGVFVALALGSAAAATSPDGITWTAQAMPSSQDWDAVAYGNGVFVALAASKTASQIEVVATSP